VPADSASEIVKFTISIPRELCTNAKAKYSSSVVPPDPSVHFYHCVYCRLDCFVYYFLTSVTYHRRHRRNLHSQNYRKTDVFTVYSEKKHRKIDVGLKVDSHYSCSRAVFYDRLLIKTCFSSRQRPRRDVLRQGRIKGRGRYG